jgi:histidine triad (HIT) family protein
MTIFSAVYYTNMDSIFTKILKGIIPTEIIYEDEHTFVIPDKFPSMPDQLLVISKRQVSYLFDLSDEEYAALFATTKLIAAALDQISGKERTCLVVEGFEVPHVHVRLYPCNEPGIVLQPKIEVSDEVMAQLSTRMKAVLR